MRKQSPTEATVWPRFVSRATSSYVLCSPTSSLRGQPNSFSNDARQLEAETWRGTCGLLLHSIR